jgi:serine protease
VAYTNLPYITDAGASCGANFNGLGPKAGVTIVEGHEFAETETDPFPSSGWLDSRGAENGDKCAWISSGQGASANVTLSTGTFPVQSLWSNAFNGGSGGCVQSYP